MRHHIQDTNCYLRAEIEIYELDNRGFKQYVFHEMYSEYRDQECFAALTSYIEKAGTRQKKSKAKSAQDRFWNG